MPSAQIGVGFYWCFILSTPCFKFSLLSFHDFIIFSLSNDFRGHVCRGSANFLQFLARFLFGANAKITDFDVSKVVKKNVLKLDVSMNYASVVEVANRIRQLMHEFFHQELLNIAPFSNKLKQVATRAQLHEHQIVWYPRSFRLEGFVKLHNVRVSKSLEKGDLFDHLFKGWGHLIIFYWAIAAQVSVVDRLHCQQSA